MGAAESSEAKIGRLDKRLQTRLRRGVDVNVKIVVRGARKVGKTRLLDRLQGKKVSDWNEYEPTAEIAVSHVHWRNRLTSEVVKVEAWEIVDQAIVSSAASPHDKTTVGMDTLAGIPWDSAIEQSRQKRFGSFSMVLLDSSNIDVNRNASASILVFDPRNLETLQHVVDIAMQTPSDVALVFLENFQDLELESENLEEIEAILRQLRENRPDHIIHHMKTSMVSSLGLSLLYSYFHIPFLIAKRKALEAQLRSCEVQLNDSLESISTNILNASQRTAVPDSQKLTIALDMTRGKEFGSPSPAPAKESEPKMVLKSKEKNRTETKYMAKTMHQPNPEPEPDAFAFCVSADQNSLEAFLGGNSDGEDDGIENRSSRAILKDYVIR